MRVLTSNERKRLHLFSPIVLSSLHFLPNLAHNDRALEVLRGVRASDAQHLRFRFIIKRLSSRSWKTCCCRCSLFPRYFMMFEWQYFEAATRGNLFNAVSPFAASDCPLQASSFPSLGTASSETNRGPLMIVGLGRGSQIDWQSTLALREQVSHFRRPICLSARG